MPIYQYQCKNCNHVFDKINMISARKEPCNEPCPECNEQQVEQLIGAPKLVAGVDGGQGTRLPGWYKARKQEMHKNKLCHENFANNI